MKKKTYRLGTRHKRLEPHPSMPVFVVVFCCCCCSLPVNGFVVAKKKGGTAYLGVVDCGGPWWKKGSGVALSEPALPDLGRAFRRVISSIGFNG
jgi:hypothetical protein